MFKSEFFKSTFYKFMFYNSTFYKLALCTAAFYRSSQCVGNPFQSSFYTWVTSYSTWVTSYSTWVTAKVDSDLLIKNMITDRINDAKSYYPFITSITLSEDLRKDNKKILGK